MPWWSSAPPTVPPDRRHPSELPMRSRPRVGPSTSSSRRRLARSRAGSKPKRASVAWSWHRAPRRRSPSESVASSRRVTRSGPSTPGSRRWNSTSWLSTAVRSRSVPTMSGRSSPRRSQARSGHSRTRWGRDGPSRRSNGWTACSIRPRNPSCWRCSTGGSGNSSKRPIDSLPANDSRRSARRWA